MKLNSANQELIGKYLFLDKILQIGMEPYDGNGGIKIDDLTIGIEKVSDDLIFKIADNVGLRDNFCKISDGRISKQAEYLFVIDNEGKIIRFIDWSRDGKEEGDKYPVYKYLSCWRVGNEDGPLLFPSFLEVNCLVWVTVQAWHKNTKNCTRPGSIFGKFCSRSVKLTVYDKLESEIVIISKKLDKLCRMFQDKVFFNGMKEIIGRLNERAVFGRFGPVNILYTNLKEEDYDKITIEDARSWVIYRINQNTNGICTIGTSGTLLQIQSLIETVVVVWNNSSAKEEIFVT